MASCGSGHRWLEGLGTRIVSPRHELQEVTKVRAVRVSEARPYFSWRPGTAATATVEIDGLALTLVSLYGLMEPRDSYAAVNRHLAGLAPLLGAPAHFRQVIVGGDLNLTSQWSGNVASYAAIDRALLDQFRAWGLRDLVAESATGRLEECPCDEGDACRHRQTWWQKRATSPRQNDYLFTSKRLRRTITLQIDEHGVREGLSDHAPLVATIA